MDESIRALFERQARWQESRKDLSWEEKIRMVEQVKDGVARWLPEYRRPSGPVTPPNAKSYRVKG
jgi:hypothetical protein